MDSYDTLMKGGTHGPAIIPGKSEESRLVLMLEGKVQPRMPFGGDPLPAMRRLGQKCNGHDGFSLSIMLVIQLYRG